MQPLARPSSGSDQDSNSTAYSFEEYLQRAAAKLVSTQYKLWEHAMFLSHHYEWQAAADVFQGLADNMRGGGSATRFDMRKENKEGKALCLTNAGWLKARLGDYAASAATLSTATHTDCTLPLPCFLLGLVESERGRHVDAQRNLLLCIAALNIWRPPSMSIASDFVLDTALVTCIVQMYHPLRNSSSTTSCSDATTMQLVALSGNLIVELPGSMREDKVTLFKLITRSDQREAGRPGEAAFLIGMPHHRRDAKASSRFSTSPPFSSPDIGARRNLKGPGMLSVSSSLRSEGRWSIGRRSFQLAIRRIADRRQSLVAHQARTPISPTTSFSAPNHAASAASTTYARLAQIGLSFKSLRRPGPDCQISTSSGPASADRMLPRDGRAEHASMMPLAEFVLGSGRRTIVAHGENPMEMVDLGQPRARTKYDVAEPLGPAVQTPASNGAIQRARDLLETTAANTSRHDDSRVLVHHSGMVGASPEHNVSSRERTPTPTSVASTPSTAGPTTPVDDWEQNLELLQPLKFSPPLAKTETRSWPPVTGTVDVVHRDEEIIYREIAALLASWARRE